MITILVHDMSGSQVDSLQLDERLLGEMVRPQLLKQAYVRYHANRRLGTAATRNRRLVDGSTRKLSRQKGSGNARRGAIRTNVMRGGGVAFAKRPKSWRLAIPRKMRRLANRNAMLSKAVDGEIKLVEAFQFVRPSSQQFRALLEALQIDRSCLIALGANAQNEALSARNLPHVTVTQVDQLNAFDLLNHRYLLLDKPSFEAWVQHGAGGTPASEGN